MRCLVVGGGNIAHSLAAAISRLQDVTVLTRRPNDWGLHVNDSPFPVHATNDPFCAADAEIIFIALPGLALRETLARIDPYLRSGQTICFTPANALVPEIVETYAPKGVAIACLQRVPYISRIEEYGHRVKMSPPRAVHKLYVSQEEMREPWTGICRDFFEGAVEFVHSPLTFVFNNSNPLLHPSRLVVLFRDWRNRVFDRNPPFYAEWTDESSEIYIRADAEMREVIEAADQTGVCQADYESVLAHYGVSTSFEMTAKLRSIEGFKAILSPMRERPDGTWVPDLESRYFTEDIEGTRAIQAFARRFGVPTPTIDELVGRMGELTSKG